ncbi:MAG: type II toxin-antitoxin system VapC family toxin [Promethearchaeota archaeon]
MKMIKIFLESSALWNLYYDEEGASLVEFCLNQDMLSCCSSSWSPLELHRGIKKRLNQQEISFKEAENLRLFIEADLQLLISKKKIYLIPVSQEIINRAKEYIHLYNLYASDALQLATANIDNCRGMLVDDYHFKRLDKRIKTEQGQEIWSTLLKIENFSSELDL